MSVPARACRARGMKVSRWVRGLSRMLGCAIMGYVGRDFEPSLNQSSEATVFFVKGDIREPRHERGAETLPCGHDKVRYGSAPPCREALRDPPPRGLHDPCEPWHRFAVRGKEVAEQRPKSERQAKHSLAEYIGKLEPEEMSSVRAMVIAHINPNVRLTRCKASVTPLPSGACPAQVVAAPPCLSCHQPG
jgi:hypothetical protein